MKQPKKRISLTLDPEIIKKLTILAEKDDRSLSQYINKLLKTQIAAAEDRAGTAYTHL